MPYGPESVSRDETYVCNVFQGSTRDHQLQTRLRLRWSLSPFNAWLPERERRGRVRIESLQQDDHALEGASLDAVRQSAVQLTEVFSSSVQCSPNGAVSLSLRGPVGHNMLDHELKVVLLGGRMLHLEFDRQAGRLPAIL